MLGQTNDRSNGEVPIDGLYQAINRDSVLPRSVVFLVTDDGAVDYDLEPKVLAILRAKQITVHFLITGSICATFATVYCKVYENIARATDGMTIHMQRSEIKGVIESLKMSLDPHFSNLVTIIYEAAGTKDIPVNIDSSIQEICANVAGKNPKLTIRGPNGEQLRTIVNHIQATYQYSCVENKASGEKIT